MGTGSYVHTKCMRVSQGKEWSEWRNDERAEWITSEQTSECFQQAEAPLYRCISQRYGCAKCQRGCGYIGSNTGA